MPPSALHDAAKIAYSDMLEQIDPRNLALRGKTALFENFGTAMLVLAVVAGGLLLGVLYYYCMTALTLGRKAWRGHHLRGHQPAPGLDADAGRLHAPPR